MPQHTQHLHYITHNVYIQLEQVEMCSTRNIYNTVGRSITDYMTRDNIFTEVQSIEVNIYTADVAIDRPTVLYIYNIYCGECMHNRQTFCLKTLSKMMPILPKVNAWWLVYRRRRSPVQGHIYTYSAHMRTMVTSLVSVCMACTRIVCYCIRLTSCGHIYTYLHSAAAAALVMFFLYIY